MAIRQHSPYLVPLTFALFALSGMHVAAQPASDAAVAAQIEVDEAAAASQAQINDLVDQTQDSATRYAQAMAELDSLNQYNEQLQQQVTSQEEEMASIESQLTEIEVTNREVLPLMERMVAYLDRFVAADVPFLIDERKNRVNNLKELMPRSDVAISEKYRRILEAYQIELEFGSTLSAYEGVLNDGGSERTVEFLQLGRIALMYHTLDGNEAGYWNADTDSWVVDNNYLAAVSDALAVAREEGAPDLLRVPVPAPQEVAQ